MILQILILIYNVDLDRRKFVPKKSTKKARKALSTSNVPIEWRKCLNKKTTSSFEIIRLVKPCNEEDYTNFPVTAFVRIKACKRVLTFKGISSSRTVKYFLDLPDLLFCITSYAGRRPSHRHAIIQTEQVNVFGLNGRNQLLILPLTNLGIDGELCCNKVKTKIESSDKFDEVLYQHLKDQINRFYVEKFSYDGYGFPIHYNIDHRQGIYHEIWIDWNNKTKANKKFKFNKSPIGYKHFLEKNIVTSHTKNCDRYYRINHD